MLGSRYYSVYLSNDRQSDAEKTGVKAVILTALFKGEIVSSDTDTITIKFIK